MHRFKILASSSAVFVVLAGMAGWIVCLRAHRYLVQRVPSSVGSLVSAMQAEDHNGEIHASNASPKQRAKVRSIRAGA
jgi:hypothetical protein